MSNVFQLPTEDECTIVLQPVNVRVDITEAYEMYINSKKEATQLQREDAYAYRPIFIDKFKAVYGVELSVTAATLLIQTLSFSMLDLKKKCSGLPTYSDFTLDSQQSSTQETPST